MTLWITLTDSSVLVHNLGMAIHDDNFKNLPALMQQIAAQHEFEDGDALLALIYDPPGEQKLVALKELPVSAYLDSHLGVSKVLRDVMQTLPIGQRDEMGIRFCTLTVLVRRGLTVFGPYESQWMLAWRYSNHSEDAFTTDVALVTEHGWCDFMSDDAGHEPRLAA